MSTSAAMAARSALKLDRYINKPGTCSHPSGMRAYGALGLSRICDLWPSRGDAEGEPDASSSKTNASKTPMNPPEYAKVELGLLRPSPRSPTSGLSTRRLHRRRPQLRWRTRIRIRGESGTSQTGTRPTTTTRTCAGLLGARTA